MIFRVGSRKLHHPTGFSLIIDDPFDYAQDKLSIFDLRFYFE
jgi:hypothetical protein